MADKARSRSRPLHGLALAAAAIALTACLGPLFPGECSDEERAAFESFEHYGTERLVPEDDALGGCRGTFASEGDPQEVIEHYQSSLEAAGWVVERTHAGPILDASGNRVGTVFDLAAAKGPMGATITAEALDGEPGRWVVLVHRLSQ